ncbi:MAG: hypothetical protein IKT08_03100 [Bacteroidales bacterium]|nr:hypothetical protein [Bacteroidales bacterium]
MKYKSLTIHLIVVATLMSMVLSCTKEPFDPSFIDDKNKIDIKGSLSNGDMKNPNIEAGYWGKTVYVYFHDYMGECVVSISDQQDEILFSDTMDTHPEAATRFYMGDQPLGRYHLVISNGTDEADGWFNNYRIVVHERDKSNTLKKQ